MTPTEIEAFANSGPVSFRLTLPVVGFQDSARPVLRVFASENKIALFTGDEDRDPAVSVYSSAERIGDSVLLQTVKPFPVYQLVLTKLKPESPKFKEYDDSFEDLDDRIGGNWESLREKATRRMAETQVWEAPPRTVTVHYMTWYEWSMTGRLDGARGIVAVPEGGRKIVGVTFPGREADAAQWNHYVNTPENPRRALEGLTGAVSQYVMFSDPREMNGHSWEDATQRALFDYAAEIYAKTNRSPF